MKHALVLVGGTISVEAVALVTVTGCTVLEVDISRALSIDSRTVLCDVTLPSGRSAGGAVRSELAVGLAAEAGAALGSVGQLAGLGVTAGVCTLL